MQTKSRSIKARIDRILQQFTRADEPDLIHFVSGVNDADAGAIDDGIDYRDPLKSKKPDFVQKELDGWQ